jgi:hypothetical protein
MDFMGTPVRNHISDLVGLRIYWALPFCHCEEQSDEAILVRLLWAEIAMPSSHGAECSARNDERPKGRNDKVRLINQATTKSEWNV